MALAALGGAAVVQDTPGQMQALETLSTLSYAYTGRRASEGRPPASEADRPIEIVAMRYARNGAPNMAVQHRSPGDQREFQRFLDQGETSARQIDRLAIDAIDADTGDRIDERLPDLSGELASDLPQFALPENIQDVLPEEDMMAVPRKRGKTGGGMNLRFTGGHELDSFWECCRPPTSMAYRTPI